MKSVDYVFHAAALKQVPSCEFFPLEAIRTNCLGAENVMNVALHCGVKNLIILSTDKAVYPINAMGVSKGLMEKLMIAKARMYGDKQTVFCGTRYGEKLYESLLNREEMAKAEDMGNYYRVPADCRDLNYSCYFTEGAEEFSQAEEYNSYNTARLDVDGMCEMLMNLEIVRKAIHHKGHKEY